jgi:hypothetical protein
VDEINIWNLVRKACVKRRVMIPSSTGKDTKLNCREFDGRDMN